MESPAASTDKTKAESSISPTELGPFPHPWLRYASYATLILVIVFFAYVRARLRNAPLERDEGEYAYAGQLMLEGIAPYKLAYNMKLPGTYAAYAVIMAIFGQTPAAIRTGVLLVNAATSILVFLLAKRLHGPVAGIVAGATYALLSTRFSVLGLDGHATHFVTLFAVAGILLLLLAIDFDRVALFFGSGLALGLSFVMKQNGILFAVFAGVYGLWTLRKLPGRDLALRGARFAAGVIIPFLLVCLIVLRAGAFREFWFWTVSYGRAYGSEKGVAEGWESFRSAAPWIVRPILIWAIAGVGLTTLRGSRKVRAQATFTAGFLLFSFLAVCPGLYFRPHYFIVLLPAIALWTGIGVAAPYQDLCERRPGAVAGVPLLVFLIALLLSIYGQRKILIQWDAMTVFRNLHQAHGCGDGCAEAVAVADYVRANSYKQDQIAVLGSEPEIYFYSHRHSATGYLYMFGLTEKQKFAASMLQQMMTELEQARPKFVVYVDDGYSWWNLGKIEDPRIQQRVENWVLRLYQLDRQIPVPGDAEHRWGDQPAFYIFCRKD